MPPDTPIPGPAEARRRLYDLMRQDLPAAQKAGHALALGKQYLGVENGHLTRIDPNVDYWEILESTDGTDGRFPIGLTLDLGETYCRRTIQQDEPIAVHNAPTQGWTVDPAYESHELDTYHGVAMEVADEVYGTVCFVSDQSRERVWPLARPLDRAPPRWHDRGRHRRDGHVSYRFDPVRTSASRPPLGRCRPRADVIGRGRPISSDRPHEYCSPLM